MSLRRKQYLVKQDAPDVIYPDEQLLFHEEVDTYLHRALPSLHHETSHLFQFTAGPFKALSEIQVDPQSLQEDKQRLVSATQIQKKKASKKSQNKKSQKMGQQSLDAPLPMDSQRLQEKPLSERIADIKLDFYKRHADKIEPVRSALQQMEECRRRQQENLEKYEQEIQESYGRTRSELGLPPLRIGLEAVDAWKELHLLKMPDDLKDLNQSRERNSQDNQDTQANTKAAQSLLPPINRHHVFQDQLDLEMEEGRLEVEGKDRQQPAAQVEPLSTYSTRQTAHLTRRLMKQLELRLNYLKNPRFKSKEMKESTTDPQNNMRGFRVEPAEVEFTSFQVKGVYQQRISLLNTSTQSCRFRLIYPAVWSSLFHFERQNTEGSEGLVPPGCRSSYLVTFRPQSLHNVEESIEVEMEGGLRVTIPLRGRRQSPFEQNGWVLPSLLDCGSCRAGFTTVRSFTISAGAKTKERMGATSKDQSTTTSKTSDCRMRGVVIAAEDLHRAESILQQQQQPEGNHLHLNSFDISPAQFEWGSEPMDLTVKFTPHPLAEGVFQGQMESVELSIYFDNGTSIPVTVQGTSQRARVQVLSWSEENALGLVQEWPLVSSSCSSNRSPDSRSTITNERIVFGSQPPHCLTTKQIRIRNLSDMTLPYYWLFDEAKQEESKPGDHLKSQTQTHRATGQRGEKTFSISPNRGVLSPGQETSFTLLFAPMMTTSSIESIASLLIANGSQDFYRAPRWLTPTGTVQEELTVCTLHLLGECVPASVQFTPPQLLLPEQLYLHDQVNNFLRVTNSSPFPMAYHIEVLVHTDQEKDAKSDHEEKNMKAPIKIKMTKLSGQVPARASLALGYQIQATGLGKASGLFRFHLQHGGPPTEFPFGLSIVMPPSCLLFDPPLVYFGVMQPLTSSSVRVPLVNQLDCSVEWLLQSENKDELQEWKFHPRHGVLKAREQVEIQFQFHPTRPYQLNTLIECLAVLLPKRQQHQQVNKQIVNSIGKQRVTVCQVVGQCVHRKARFSLSQLDFGTSYLHMPRSASLRLTNETPLPTRFQVVLGKTESEDDRDAPYEMTWTPEEGELQGKETIEINVSLTPHRVVDLLQIPLHVYIESMPAGRLEVDVLANVLGFDYEIEFDNTVRTVIENLETGEVEQSSERQNGVPEFELDFGTSPIFARRSRSFILHNRSGLIVPFRMDFEKFGQYEKGQQESLQDSAMKELSNANQEMEVALQRVAEKGIGFQSVKGQHYAGLKTNSRSFARDNEKVLRRRQGLAFRAEPDQGILQPFESLQVDIIAYSNLWGHFEDELVLYFNPHAENQKQKGPSPSHDVSSFEEMERIPMRMDVVGAPLRFVGHGMASADGLFAKLNFGVRLNVHDESKAESVQVTKTIEITNYAPKEIQIDWKSFELKDWSMQRPIRFDLNQRELPTTGRVLCDIALGDHYALEDGACTPVEIIPSTLCIPAFGRSKVAVCFKSSNLGRIKAVALGELGYRTADGRLIPARALPPVAAASNEFYWERVREAGPLELDISGRVVQADIKLQSTQNKEVVRIRCHQQQAEVVPCGRHRNHETKKTSSRRRWHKKGITFVNPIDAVVYFKVNTSGECLEVKVNASPNDARGFFALNPLQEIVFDLIWNQNGEETDVNQNAFIHFQFSNGQQKQIAVVAEFL